MNPGFILSLTLPEVLLLALYLWMPIVRQQALFGVPVSIEFYQGDGRQILRRYRFWLIAIYSVIIALGFVFAWQKASPNLAAIAAIVASVSVFPVYAIFYRAVAPHWLRPDSSRVASSLRPRRLAEYTFIPIEILVLLLTLLPAIVAWHYYDRLPDRIPVHWNLALQPDRWTAKSVGMVAFGPALAFYLQVFLLLMKRDTTAVKMRLPAQDVEEFLQAKEELLRAGLRLVDWTRLTLAAVLCSTGMLMFFCSIAELRRFRGIHSVLSVVSDGLLLLGTIWFFLRWLTLSRRIGARFGSLPNERGNESPGWYGGLIYFNPRDPAFILEKLDGLGYTMNLGNRRVLPYLALSLALPVLLFWAGGV